MRACGLRAINMSCTIRSCDRARICSRQSASPHLSHRGKDAHSGHYYAMGRRLEPTVSGHCSCYAMDDSQIKEADVSVLAGKPPEKLVDDNAYVLFLRRKQAPPSPEFRIPLSLVRVCKEARQEAKSEAELKMVIGGVSQPPPIGSLIFSEAPVLRQKRFSTVVPVGEGFQIHQ